MGELTVNTTHLRHGCLHRGTNVTAAGLGDTGQEAPLNKAAYRGNFNCTQPSACHMFTSTEPCQDAPAALSCLEVFQV